MSISKIFLYALVLLSVDKVYVSGHKFKDCVDCRSVYACEPALNIVKSQKKNVTSDSRKALTHALCGFDNHTPKVCCEEFHTSEISLETHPNIALLPKECGDNERKVQDEEFYSSRYIADYPWMALISYNTSNRVEFGCTASVVNSRYILTAGHCVTSDKEVKKIAGIHVGLDDLRHEAQCEDLESLSHIPALYDSQKKRCEIKIQVLRVEDIIIHKDYIGHQPLHADIALIRLRDPIDLSYENVEPICLPVFKNLQEVNLASEFPIIMGWGLADNDLKSLLWESSVSLLIGEDCNKYYERPQERDENTFCAGEARWNPCKGDSGAPLIISGQYNGTYRYVQFGVVSSNPKECNSSFPGVYTDVTKHMRWILDNMKD